MAQGKPNSCVICEHPQRTAIDRAIMAGDSLRDIGTMFGTDKNAVQRHKNVCWKRTGVTIAPTITTYQTPAEVAIASQNVRSVAQRAGQLVDKMEALAQRFEDKGDTHGILKAAKEIREGLRLLAQLSGELSPNQVNVAVMAPSMRDAPEWGIFVKIVEKYPQVKAELQTALLECGS